MAILRPKDIRKLGKEELDKKLSELRLELSREMANISVGASATSPGRIGEIKRTIARVITIRKEAVKNQ